MHQRDLISSEPVGVEHHGLDRDLWLADRIHLYAGRRAGMVFARGTMTAAERRAALRYAILKNNLREVVLGQHNGKAETFAAWWLRNFREELGA
jgi:hypothetical protein